MRIVSPGDSGGEQGSSPRFRLFAYVGADSSHEVHDLVACSIEQALDAAYRLSGGDARLWSLALVPDRAEEPEDARRGLTWLSGFDAHRRPANPAEWRLRGQMQDRYLRARSQRGEAPLLPNGLRVIRMFPEWCVGLPLWESFTDSYPVRPGELPISRALEGELEVWNREWESHGLDATRSPAWFERGWELYEEVQRALANIAEVRPDLARGY